MATVDFLTFILILSVVLMLSVAEEDCPDTFACGPLRNLGFPFRNASQPHCGLISVDCEAERLPRVQLVPDGPWYEANSSQWWWEILIVLRDQQLQRVLDNKNCSGLGNYTIKLPSSPSVSFVFVHPAQTIFRCNNDKERRKKINDRFQGYADYNCPRKAEDPNFIIYYNGSTPIRDGFPANCSAFVLPTKLPYEVSMNAPDVFSLLKADFSLSWNLTTDCHSCLSSGGRCQDNGAEFHCKKPRAAGRSRVKLILGTVLGGLLFIMSIGILAYCLIKRGRQSSAYLFSRNDSSGPLRSRELDGGSGYFGIPVFPNSELEEATNNFNSSKELGDGGFGTVYHGKLRDGREVAVKRLYDHNFKRVEQFRNEIEILTRLRHPNLVSLYGCTSRRSRELLLVYEYIPNGTVADHLHGETKSGSLTWPIRMKIAIETAAALAYLHANDIIHRDVKTNNILLDNNFTVKVADFGLSRLFPNDVTHISTAPQGTPGYVDPDYHECYQLTDKSDVYSFGVVLAELISSMPAVDIRRSKYEINLANFTVNRIQRSKYNELIDPTLGFESDTEIQRMTTSVAETAFRCLQPDKEMRPKMDEVLETLKGIQAGEEFKDWKKEIETHVRSDTTADHACDSSELDSGRLLTKEKLPSPNSVAMAWMSRSTSSASG